MSYLHRNPLQTLPAGLPALLPLAVTAAALALLVSHKPLTLKGRIYRAILIPTAPVPYGGGLLFVPAEWVEPASFGIEAFTGIYGSMGVTAPHFAQEAQAGQTTTG